MIISLSSKRIFSESDSRKQKYDAKMLEAKRLSILNNYNKIVEAIALAEVAGKKQTAKALRQKRLDFLNGIKTQGFTLPEKVGRIVRKSIDEILSKVSDKADFMKPSQIKHREEGELLVNNQKAKKLLSLLDKDVVSEISKLDSADQKRVIGSIKREIEKLRNFSHKAALERKPDIRYARRLINSPNAHPDIKKEAQGDIDLLTSEYEARRQLLKDPKKLGDHLTKMLKDRLTRSKNDKRIGASYELHSLQKKANQNRYVS